jgi:hypothetical protein
VYFGGFFFYLTILFLAGQEAPMTRGALKQTAEELIKINSLRRRK